MNPIDLESEKDEAVCQIASIGTIIGSSKDGTPIEQNFSKAAFDKIAADLNANENTEILVDAEHASLRPLESKDSQAVAWASEFESRDDGLFAKLKFTSLGKKLINSRIYRFLSPVFRLNSNKEPTELVSIGATNVPSQTGRITPIINSYSDMGALIVTPPEVDEEKEDEDFIENSNEGKIKMEVTKEELAEMIKAMVETCLAAKTEEVKEEVKEEEVVENTCEEVKEEEVANVEETESEEEVKAEEKKEVIQAEALNSAPTLAISVAEVSDYEKALDASLQKNGGHFTRI